MLRLKSSARIIGLQPETALAIMIAASVFDSFDLDCVITSVTDSPHSRRSLHYVGFAFDTRRWHVGSEELVKRITQRLKEALGNDFDVVLESDHWHIEFQPEKPLNLD